MTEIARVLIHTSGWRVELDAGQFHDGGTPALVLSPRGDAGTWDCARDTGHIMDCRCRDLAIPASVLKWMDAIEDEVEAFLATRPERD